MADYYVVRDHPGRKKGGVIVDGPLVLATPPEDFPTGAVFGDDGLHLIPVDDAERLHYARPE